MTFNKTDFINVNTPKGSFDFNLFAKIINQGIDAHLEAFTQSKFLEDTKNPARFNFFFHKSELPILLRRLKEFGQEEFIMWSNDIALVANRKFGTQYETE